MVTNKQKKPENLSVGNGLPMCKNSYKKL